MPGSMQVNRLFLAVSIASVTACGTHADPGAAGSPPVRADSGSLAESCESVRFAGSVTEGQRFERPIAAGLQFRLEPGTDPVVPGWTLQIRTATLDSVENELTWAATPPFRGWNPRYIDTSYGKTAQEALDHTNRAFHYVGPEDYARLVAAIRMHVWSYGFSQAQLDSASHVIETVRKYAGLLRITHGSVAPTSDGRGKIARLEFEVDVCVPRS